MKLSITKSIILPAALMFGLMACTKEETTDTTDYALDYESSTLIKGFNIKANTKILENLDSVFFSIDQVNARIFNADSLPWGTDVRKLVVNITTQRSATCEIVMPSLYTGKDTTVATSDSINFTGANGVWLRVTSSNEDFVRIYSVKVNVHQCNPDSMQWDMQSLPLPCSWLSDVKESQSVEFGGKFYCLARNDSEVMMYTADNPGSLNWESTAITTLPAATDVNSLCAADDALYVLTEAGELMSSTDGMNWTEAATGWTHLYGAYGADVMGVKAGEWVAYPSGKHGALAPGMPVEGTSRMWTYKSDWAITPTSIFVGGKDSSGNLSANAWGYDGVRWAQLSGLQQVRMLPPAEDITLFPYFTFKISTATYLVNKQSAWFAIGGKLADGTLNDKVYVSLDNGINWSEAPDDLQLPAVIKPRSKASALFYNHTFVEGRAVKPITEWDAPYLYMMGGYDANGTLYKQTWVGVINRLTFKPLQ